MSGAQKKKKVRPVCWAENGFIFDNTHSSVRAPPCRVASSYPGRPSADAATEPPPVPGRSSVSVSRGMFAAAAASVQGYDAQGSVTHACACAVGCSPDRAATRQLHVCAADVSVTIARARRRRRVPARRISTGAPLAARRLAPSGSPAGSPRGWEVRAGTRVRSSVPLYRHVSPPSRGAPAWITRLRFELAGVDDDKNAFDTRAPPQTRTTVAHGWSNNRVFTVPGKAFARRFGSERFDRVERRGKIRNRRNEFRRNSSKTN